MVIVEGCNRVKKHVNPQNGREQGGIHHRGSSALCQQGKLVCPRWRQADRLAHKIMNDGSKENFARNQIVAKRLSKEE
jgi:large subunit ribosomal protein L24